jgi:hypothetical protein
MSVDEFTRFAGTSRKFNKTNFCNKENRNGSLTFEDPEEVVAHWYRCVPAPAYNYVNGISVRTTSLKLILPPRPKPAQLNCWLHGSYQEKFGVLNLVDRSCKESFKTRCGKV